MASTASLLAILLAMGLGWLGPDFWMLRLFPYGLPRMSKDHHQTQPSYASMDPRHDGLQAKHGKLTKIYERGSKGLLRSPETVVFGPDGTLYTATDQGLLISLHDIQEDPNSNGTVWTAETTLIKDLGPGRPLGAKFTKDGNTLYLADAMLGLIRVQNLTTDPNSKVEIVVSKVMNDDDDGTWTTINFADDLTIGPKTGRVYFTDASTVVPPRNLDLTIDVMYGSKVDSVVGPSGRLLQYDPMTDHVEVLAEDLWFANGVSVDAEESYLVVAETFRLGLIKYHLKGDLQGTMEYIVKGAPLSAYVDGVDCAWPGVTVDASAYPYCYVANPSLVVPAHKVIWKLPPPLDWMAKTIILFFPKELTPHTQPYGGVSIVDGVNSVLVNVIQDPTGQDIGHITGVTVHDNRLYLGSLENNFIGVYHLK